MLEHVVPAPDRLVRDPARKWAVMPAEGWEVNTVESYWLRRLRDGDVTVRRPARPAPEAIPDAIPARKRARKER